MIPEYNGWTNFPTWATFTWLSSDEDTYDEARKMAMGAQNAEQALKRHVEDMVYGDEYVEPCLRSEFIGWALEYVNWPEVIRGLRGE